MTDLSAFAGGRAQQANFGGDNYAPITFASGPAPKPSLHQLPPGIQDFSGRASDVAEIERLADHSGSGPSVINVFGAPGIGKSALTMHVAHRLMERYDQIQLYAELGELDDQVPASTHVLQRFVAALDPSAAVIPIGAQDLPARYRSLLSGYRCLIVLDDAQSADQIADLVPGTSKSVVLVTSRAPLVTVQGIIPYHLGLMSPAESLGLLSAVSRRTWPDGRPPDAAVGLVEQCGRLPLALRIVGAILKKKPHWTLEKVAGNLAEEATRLEKLAEGQLDVHSCFEVSYRHLSTNEARAFRLLSLLPLGLFKLRDAACFLQQSEGDAEHVIETLVDAQLLETEDGRYFRFHDLLRLYARERSQVAADDPDGTRVALFVQGLAAEFLQSYSRCLRENRWTGPRRLRELGRASRERFQAKPDSLYLPTRLIPASETAGLPRSWHDLLALDQRVLVLGAGGTGKTVLADRICYEIAAAQQSAAAAYEVGFTVRLRQRGDRAQTLERLIADAVRSRYHLDLPQETLTTLLRERRAVLIFDGLDEMPVSAQSQVMRDINAFCSSYPSVRVVVTSRPVPAIKSIEAAAFQRYEIAPITDADISLYITRWAAVAKTAPNAYASLLKAISSSGISRGWLSTPLLMTQLITTYDMTGAVPQREVELYDTTYSILFENRDALRGIRRSRGLSAQQLGRLVSYLAYQLKARTGVSGIPEQEFLDLLVSYFHTADAGRGGEFSSPREMRRISDDVAALDLPVRRTLEDSPDGEPRWSVTRDAFSEYLAARWILDGGSPN